jgi:hypothetical protein
VSVKITKLFAGGFSVIILARLAVFRHKKAHCTRPYFALDVEVVSIRQLKCRDSRFLDLDASEVEDEEEKEEVSHMYV